MRVAGSLGLVAVLSASVWTSVADAAKTPDALELLQGLNDQAIQALEEAAQEESKRSVAGCSLHSAGLRKDWDDLCPSEKKDYISAVQCLLTTPSKVDPSIVPGARTRYDDFVAIHINQTLSIHGTGNFLTWHRSFVHAYETALREECGYKGYQPYWNWFKYQDDPSKAPLFDGSEYSLSGDGEFWEHDGTTTGIGFIQIPSGNGGGCVKSGPLANMTVNIGPIRPDMNGLEPNPEGQYAYNPRCLSRDLSSYTLSKWMTATNLMNVTVGDASRTILSFQNELQGRFADGFLGMHAAGHISIGGEATDLFSSPNDPSFFLHHAMVDRVYWIWQALHPRQANTIAGTITILNNPPSRNAVKEDPIYMNVLGEDNTIGRLLNTLGGEPLCYIYV